MSESSIKHFHKELLKYSDKDERHRGSYKSGSNRVEAKNASGKVLKVLFDPSPPHLVQKEMLELVEWTNHHLKTKEFHPLLVVANFVFEFLSIHPFQDGNGRCSRILTNLLFLKTGYEYSPYVSHEKLIEDNKNEYYLALNKSQKTWGKRNENISPWLRFFLTIVLQQTRMAIRLIEGEAIEHLLSEKQLFVWNYLLSNSMVTPKEIREALKMPAATVLQSLNKLLQLKKIERLGEGRGTRYRVI